MQELHMVEDMLDRAVQELSAAAQGLVLRSMFAELVVEVEVEVAEASHTLAMGKDPTSKRPPTSMWDVEGILM
jgi:hypothetical protein